MAWDTEGTKRKILDAATVEFAERGPDGTTVERIAKLAGVNKERVYNYFGGKPELFARVLREQFGRALTDTVHGTLLVALPNLPYAICVTQLRDAGEVIVSIATVVGRIDWTTPGVTDVLLRDNNNLMLARFVRDDEMLKVDYEVLAAATTAEGLAGGVKAVASAAVWGHATMLAAGALLLTEEIL